MHFLFKMFSVYCRYDSLQFLLVQSSRVVTIKNQKEFTTSHELSTLVNREDPIIFHGNVISQICRNLPIIEILAHSPYTANFYKPASLLHFFHHLENLSQKYSKNKQDFDIFQQFIGSRNWDLYANRLNALLQK